MSKYPRGHVARKPRASPSHTRSPLRVYTYTSECFRSLVYEPTRLLDGNRRGPRKDARVGIPPNGLGALLPRRPALGTKGRHCVRGIDASVRVETSEHGSVRGGGGTSVFRSEWSEWWTRRERGAIERRKRKGADTDR